MITHPIDELPGDHYSQAGENELALFGACVAKPAAFDLVAEIVGADCFANPDLGAAFALLVDLASIGKPIADVRILCNELKRAGLFEKIGGAPFIAKAVSQSLPHNATFYALEVAKLANLRRLHRAVVRAAFDCTQGKADAAAIAQQTQAAIEAAQYDSAAELLELEPMLGAELAEIREAMTRGQVLGLSTGLPTLDELTGGFFNGELTVLAARPSIGKTAFAIELASRLSMKGRRVLLVSLEMTSKQIAHRFFNRETGIEVRRIQSAQLSKEEWAKLDRVREELKAMKLTTWIPKGPGGATVASIRARARVQAAQGGLDLVIVDYLGLVNHSMGRLSSYERITAISKDIKSLAIELDRPVLLLAQLNREAGKSGVEPVLEHLRDSGAIEQDADNVWLLHRENREATETKLIVAKQRQGAVGYIPFEFDPAHMSFNESTGTLWKG